MYNRYFYINQEKEKADTEKLSALISSSNWVDKNTIIVVCSPEYSSALCQHVNHQVCRANKNVPLPMYFLDMPYPGGEEYSYMEYNHMLSKLGESLHGTNKKALLLDSGVLRGMNFTIAKQVLSKYTHSDQVRYGCLYKQETSIFEPDYYVQSFDFVVDGGLLFWWENQKIPYWKY